MAAGITPSARHARIRRALQKEARENGGTYGRFHVSGKTEDGILWEASFRTLGASNGESCAFLLVTVNGTTDQATFPGSRSVREAIQTYRNRKDLACLG